MALCFSFGVIRPQGRRSTRRGGRGREGKGGEAKEEGQGFGGRCSHPFLWCCWAGGCRTLQPAVVARSVPAVGRRPTCLPPCLPDPTPSLPACLPAPCLPAPSPTSHPFHTHHLTPSLPHSPAAPLPHPLTSDPPLPLPLPLPPLLPPSACPPEPRRPPLTPYMLPRSCLRDLGGAEMGGGGS